MDLPPSTAALTAFLDALPGAEVQPLTAARGSRPLSLIYKVKGKMFAIVGAREDAFVILKSDPHLAEILREQYVGVGHRSHLDRRFWICVELEADVPGAEVERLANTSYDLVRAGLTRKQRAELEALPA